MGITIALILVAAIAFLPWVVGVVAIATLAAYSWDRRRQPIVEFSDSEAVRQQRTNIVLFVALATLLLFLIVDGLK